jgi:hypothetical protein
MPARHFPVRLFLHRYLKLAKFRIAEYPDLTAIPPLSALRAL